MLINNRPRSGLVNQQTTFSITDRTECELVSLVISFSPNIDKHQGIRLTSGWTVRRTFNKILLLVRIIDKILINYSITDLIRYIMNCNSNVMTIDSLFVIDNLPKQN